MAKQQRWPLRIVIIALLALPTARAEANDDVMVYYAGPEGGCGPPSASHRISK